MQSSQRLFSSNCFHQIVFIKLSSSNCLHQIVFVKLYAASSSTEDPLEEFFVAEE